jgi:hypothetical protein
MKAETVSSISALIASRPHEFGHGLPNILIQWILGKGQQKNQTIGSVKAYLLHHPFEQMLNSRN